MWQETSGGRGGGIGIYHINDKKVLYRPGLPFTEPNFQSNLRINKVKTTCQTPD